MLVAEIIIGGFEMVVAGVAAALLTGIASVIRTRHQQRSGLRLFGRVLLVAAAAIIALYTLVGILVAIA
jgi:hypothetical protein